MEAQRTIPFFNYRALYSEYGEEFARVLTEVCSRGAYILQDDLREFESTMRRFLAADFALGVADGTNALILGLRALGIGHGDEVIVPAHTYVASAASIVMVGASPVLADCGPDHLVDADSIESLISAKTKAIMPVHVNGRTCRMDWIGEIASKHSLYIVEDAAQALGSRFNGKAAGTFGQVGTISFYPAKVLGCFGDGGLVISSDKEIGKTLSLLRDHGRNEDGEVVCWGTNSRLDNIQAAVLNLKFKNFSSAIQRRRRIAELYNEALQVIDDLTLPPPPVEGPNFDVYQNYELQSGMRDSLRAALRAAGVATIVQWGGKAVHHHEKLNFHDVYLPNTDRLFQRCFMLPMNTSLSDDDVGYIINIVRKFYGLTPV